MKVLLAFLPHFLSCWWSADYFESLRILSFSPYHKSKIDEGMIPCKISKIVGRCKITIFFIGKTDFDSRDGPLLTGPLLTCPLQSPPSFCCCPISGDPTSTSSYSTVATSGYCTVHVYSTVQVSHNKEEFSTLRIGGNSPLVVPYLKTHSPTLHVGSEDPNLIGRGVSRNHPIGSFGWNDFGARNANFFCAF